MPIQLIPDLVDARGEKTASAMETQLTALERKIDDLLATVASSDAGSSNGDKSSVTKSANSLDRVHKHQSEEK